MEDMDELFIKAYLNDVSEKEKQKSLNNQEDRAIAEIKRNKLLPIDQFLKKFVDLEILVPHSDKYSNTRNSISPDQLFDFYYVDSSKSWAPGVSIWIDHPAIIEIAIPNNPQKEGIVVIKVASHHPDSYLLEQIFYDYPSACRAIANFLAKNTVSIKKDPKKYIKDLAQQKIQTNANNTFPSTETFRNEPQKFSDNNEPAVLKGVQNETTLKKIGNIFHLNHTSNQLQDEDE